MKIKMKIIKSIKYFFIFIFEDTKGDISFIKRLFKGELKKPKKDLLTFDLKKILQENWLFFLIVLLAFCAGYLIAAKYYQGICNQILIEKANCIVYSAKELFNITL